MNPHIQGVQNKAKCGRESQREGVQNGKKYKFGHWASNPPPLMTLLSTIFIQFFLLQFNLMYMKWILHFFLSMRCIPFHQKVKF